MSRKATVGLALGGGGARGLAHIGVLKVLEREGIPIDLITGTSMGALVGAAYAIEPDAQALEERIRALLQPEESDRPRPRVLEKLHWDETSKSDWLHRLRRMAEKGIFMGLVLVRKSLLSEKEMRELMESLLPDIDIRDTEIPYAATAVDLVSGAEVILREGPLIPAVMASCAVPTFMPPVAWGDMLLIDGAIRDTIPVEPAREMGARAVLGVDVGSYLCAECTIEDGLDLIQRVTEIMSFCISRRDLEEVDVLIEPDVRQVKWTEFSRYESLIREGEKAAESRLRDIHRAVAAGMTEKILERAKELFEGIRKKRSSDTADLSAD